MVDMANEAASEGYAIIFLTGRPASQEAATLGNLTTDGLPAPDIDAGYPTPTTLNDNGTPVDGLFTKPPVGSYPAYLNKPEFCAAAIAANVSCPTIQYKSGTRAYIESLGYDIVGQFRRPVQRPDRRLRRQDVQDAEPELLPAVAVVLARSKRRRRSRRRRFDSPGRPRVVPAASRGPSDESRGCNHPCRWTPIAFALGVFLLALTFWDLFQTVVVPRPTPGWFRIAATSSAVRGGVLRSFRGRPGAPTTRSSGSSRRRRRSACCSHWLVSLIFGYGLILYAVRDQLRPVPTDLGDALYFAATSLLTLGFGDFVAEGGSPVSSSSIAAISGLGVVALVVTFLFSLYGSYQRREMRVVMLQASAGAPPSAVALLETYAQLEPRRATCPDLFREWQEWAAEVLDSHVAYPLLGFFRSSHDNLSWISALGTVLDASSLVLTTIEGLPRGEAKLFKRMGTHLVEDIYNLGFTRGTPSRLDRADFEAACDRLAAAGYAIAPRDDAWAEFRGRARDVFHAARGDGGVLGDAGDAVARRPGRASPAAPPGGRSVRIRGAAARCSRG